MKTRFILGSALAAVLLLCGGTGKVMAQKNIAQVSPEFDRSVRLLLYDAERLPW